MSKLIAFVLISLFAASVAFAQAPAAASDCATKAVGKNGKPLAGAAKVSFMKKCEADIKGGGASGMYSGVVRQQGRVKLDSDWNEADAIGKAKAPPKSAVEAPKATPMAAARPGAEHGKASDASAGKGSAKSAGKY
jgi:hypothetical protein